MNIAFRVDASLSIGNGHVMRCLTLASILRDKGFNCIFICRDDPGNLIQLIQNRCFHVITLHVSSTLNNISSNFVFYGLYVDDWKTDAELTSTALKPYTVDLIIVDHYSLDARWEKFMHQSCTHLMVIDDLANRPHYCDLLLDQNLGREKADYSNLVPPSCAVMAGPQFALLDKSFADLRAFSLNRRVSSQLNSILITMGGVDSNNATGKVLMALKKCQLPAHLKITIVMGKHAPFSENIKGLSMTMPWNTEVLIDVNNMASLMGNSDLAIGAAGTTAWERCCLGLPSIILILADNQIQGAKALKRSGSAIVISDELNFDNQIKRALCSVSVPNTLIKMSRAAMEITDGNGSCRVVEILTNHVPARTLQ